MARKVANVGAVKQGRNTMSRSASERGRLGVSIGGCSFSGEWAADARLLRCTRQAGQLSRPSPPKSRNTSNELSDCIRLLRGEARCQGRRMRSKADVLGFRRSRSSPRRFRRLERQESTGRRLRGSRGVPEVGQLSCRVVVFMDQAAEDITAAELSGDQRLRLAIAL